ncbi:hypothetical protein A6S26_08130 [Nostoc sp. ATCC 43529]|nr:hypothetical protein A6S26_08130 [Nostoc sp. ATCC 43529]
MQGRKFIFLKENSKLRAKIEMLRQGVRIQKKSELESVMSISRNFVPLWAKQSSKFFLVKTPYLNVWSLLNSEF